MVIKDKEGNTIKKLYKDEVKAEDLPATFRQLLMCNGATKPNAEALKHYIKVCNEILEYLEKVGKRYFVAVSLFFVLSNIDNKYCLKLIDFAHVYPVELAGLKRDEQLITGIKNVIKVLTEAGK